VSLPGGNRVVQWGLRDDYAMAGDFDGDGITDFVVFRPSDGGWYFRNGRTDETRIVLYGKPGDVPAPGHYLSTDRMDMAVFRPSQGSWFIPDAPAIDFGRAGDVPVLAARRAKPMQTR
jgi:hypothetical protein